MSSAGSSRPRPLVAAVLLSSLLLSSCAGGSDPEASGDPSDPSEPSQQSAEDAAAEAEEQRRVEAEQAQEAALAGPGEDHQERAAELVAEYSLSELAGSVLVGEYATPDASGMAALIEELHLGGAIIMGANVPLAQRGVDTQELAAALSTLGEAAGEREVPPMISVDQEGGLVTRVGAPLTEWPTPMAYGAAASGQDDPEQEQPEADAQDDDGALTRSGHRFLAAELADLGFTTSFAPNGDVTVGASDPTIGSRSFGSDAGSVAELSMEGIRGLAEGGLAGSVKHFPGHGSVTEDSHQTLPVQGASLEELRARDWAPFAEAAEAGVPMVMMGHIEVPALEAGVPSSLSAAAYTELRELGHEGVVVTDALNMGAIVQGYGGDQAAVTALSAGADLLLMPADLRGAHTGIVAAVESGELDRSRLQEAAERVAALQLWQAELAAGELAAGPGAQLPEQLRGEDAEADADQESESGSPEETATELSESAVTLVAGECEADLADAGITILGGSEQDRSRLTAAAEAAGLTVGTGAVVNLVGESSAAGGDVAVALDRPEVLAGADAPTQIALYGRTQESFEALAAVLAGAEAPGALPVEVGELPRGHSAC
ncbi:beta-N-acetylhexosaminidase [Nesterenkonia sp. E16_7]|uniref:glycoside hydrolase family 3 N-terminal domain-containing protein n=1 Tax=unclassified Nesterenkonia TaxID=2629769 RepID=UPI001A937997|nr:MULTISPECIES: glycoside hydrolase family 3 N-terminal domain-containing protein [unclassified Nesterenkonia]MBO0594136.1 beta-N-acetylhexosaminidase [Nesterenkonia sp. E16_10]MBO0597582.1 beta-N-acetylhexosaminidase [Nesterenkonia sp. E16_7]